MSNQTIPLKDITVDDLYNGEPATTYEIPIYQRNYAWEKEEIAALIQDVYNAFSSGKDRYYIGTLVSFHKGDQIYEVIDGQQRLTTIFLILRVMGITCNNRLTYKARRIANATIASLKISTKKTDDMDFGIKKGFDFAQSSLGSIVTSRQEDFKRYFQSQVHLIHYQVPKDIDLNHYFEVMNSRGEQLEMSEIIKARLMEKLNDSDKAKFNRLWECCSEMNVYVQQKYDAKTERKEDVIRIFGPKLSDFMISTFDELPPVQGSIEKLSINKLLERNTSTIKSDDTVGDSFQPIIDFSNFLLIVLKLTRIEDESFQLEEFILEDKELLNQFGKAVIDQSFVKKFGYNLLKAKFLLDNYVVHHACEEDTIESNPWKLQYWQKVEKNNCPNLAGEENNGLQIQLVHLLSMFEVSFTARQRKNYLFYCLLYLFLNDRKDLKAFCRFLSNLADKFFWDVYMVSSNLNERNYPLPGCFDQVLLPKNKLNVIPEKRNSDFSGIYGDGSSPSQGIPLFIFNYLDYKIWEKYFLSLRGRDLKKENPIRKAFFEELGCSDFDLRHFDQFYFSRTRRSLEHYFPQANVNGLAILDESKINCLGNYAMIGSEANSSGSNWSPSAKLIHYLDSSKKTRPVSVASLKFFIMMQMCKDNQNLPDRQNGREWIFEDIQKHQAKMLKILGTV